MAIRWRTKQLARVQGILAAFPANSSKCANAARRVLPIARQLEAGAHARFLISRDEGTTLVTKGGLFWDHHVAVDVDRHRVDALTSARGQPKESYLATYFDYPEFVEDTPLSDAGLATVDASMEEDEDEHDVR